MIPILYIYEDERNDGIKAEIRYVPTDGKKVLVLLDTLEKTKKKIIEVLLDEMNKSVVHKKGLFETSLETMKGIFSPKEKKELETAVKDMERSLNMTQEFNSRLLTFQAELNKLSIEEKERALKDISASMINIAKGA